MINIYNKNDITLAGGLISKWGTHTPPLHSCFIKDDDYEKIKTQIKDFTYQKIQPKDKVYILSKSSSFPSTMISRVENLDIKRVLNPEKADKIIIDDIYKSLSENDSLYYTVAETEEHSFKRLTRFKSNLDEYAMDVVKYFKEDLESSEVPKVTTDKVSLLRIPKEEAEVLIKYLDKVATTNSLSEYVSDQLTPITLEELNNIGELLSNTDKGMCRMGIELLNGSNFNNLMYETIKLLRNTTGAIRMHKLHNTTSYNHLISRIGIDLDYPYADIDFYVEVYKKCKISDEAKKKIKDDSLEYIRVCISISHGRMLETFNSSVKIHGI